MSATATKILPNYINGGWVPSTSSELLDITNPATGEVLAQVPLSGANDVDAAVQAARAAFPAWKATSTIERARWLFGFREQLVQRADERRDREHQHAQHQEQPLTGREPCQRPAQRQARHPLSPRRRKARHAAPARPLACAGRSPAAASPRWTVPARWR